MIPRRISTALATLLILGCYAGADELPARPRSLAGTEVDGALRVVDGVFVFDGDARRAFDYFLSAADEVSPDELDAWVRGELARRVPAAARDDAFAAWRSYVEYRGAAAATLARGDAAPDAAEQALLDAVDANLGDHPIAADERAEVTRAFAVRRALSATDREVALSTFVDDPAFAASDAGAFLAGARRSSSQGSPGSTRPGCRRSASGNSARPRPDAWRRSTRGGPTGRAGSRRSARPARRCCRASPAHRRSATRPWRR